MARQIHQIRNELDQIGKQSGFQNRLQYALQKVWSLQESESDEDRLKLYVYSLSCLVHHSRYGGLKSTQVSRLKKLSSSVLKAEGIRSASSKRSFLYGNIHLALSAIYRVEGDVLRSLWEQEMAHLLSQRSPVIGDNTRALIQGIHLIRLGYSDLAMAQFEKVEGGKLDERALCRASLEQIKTYRLMGNLEMAEELARKSINQLQLTLDERNEVEWERLCRQATSTKDITPLVLTILRGKPHHSYEYILEVFLWTRAVQTKRWLSRFSNARALARDRKLKPNQWGFWYECVMVLEACYDTIIPFSVRLEKLEHILANIRKIRTVDQELLMWVASGRWLARNHSYELATLCLYEYRWLSFKLSGGINEDVLALADDLLNASWFRKSTNSGKQFKAVA